LIRDYVLGKMVLIENLNRIAGHVADGESRDKRTSLVQFVLTLSLALEFVSNNLDKLFYAYGVFL
jgi:hypothetical protein